MKVNQRFRSRQDLSNNVVYFENEGPLEMPEVHAEIINQLREDKTEGELLEFARSRFPEVNPEVCVKDVLETLSQLQLLS